MVTSVSGAEGKGAKVYREEDAAGWEEEERGKVIS